MAQIIAIANQKGGVGKTTTAVNLAASLAVAEQRTLLIDGDPQGNATSGIGLEGEQLTGTVYDSIIGQLPLDQVILRAIQFAHLDVAPTTPDLAGAEIELIDRENRELAMRDAIAPIRDRYDYILIDCPPSLGLLTINMLSAADSVLIPVQCEYYALEGLSQLLNTVHRIQQSVNPDLAIDGVLLTMYDARLNLSRQVVTDAREYFGPKVFDTIIPRNVRLAEAPSFGKPIVLYDIASVGAQAYLSVAREVVQRHSPSNQTPPAEISTAGISSGDKHTQSGAAHAAPTEERAFHAPVTDERHAATPAADERTDEHSDEHADEHTEEHSEEHAKAPSSEHSHEPTNELAQDHTFPKIVAKSETPDELPDQEHGAQPPTADQHATAAPVTEQRLPPIPSAEQTSEAR